MKKMLKTVLALSLATFVTSNFAAVTPADKGKIENIVRDYLLQNPDVIIQAVQNYQRKQYEQAEQTVKKTQQIAATFAAPLFHQSNDPVAGNPKGSITVVEFFDYQCPHCVDMAPVISEIIKANPDVRIVFKEFPIRGPISDYAARAALAANLQGKYYDFSHALLTAKPPLTPLTQASILEIAKNTGLDVEKLKKDMNDTLVNNQLKNNVKLAQDLKLFGTPAFFVGKSSADVKGNINYVPGRVEQTQLQDLIDKAK